jgi:GT2 family glycosyltransferase
VDSFLAVLISFIVPLYNCLQLTKEMLASLQATLPAALDYEILLIDDGSTDGTREWLGTLADARTRVILNEKNLGYAATNNRAASMAGGELLVLLNDDLVLSPGWLESMLSVFRALRKPGAVGNIQLNAATGEIDHAGVYVTCKGKPEHDVTPSKCSGSCGNCGACYRSTPAVTAACLLMARSLWQELGGFDERFRNGGEDVDLCFRAAKRGFENAVAIRSVVKHHVSASPGRKDNDERNSYLLTLRWEQELVWLGAKDWCWKHLKKTPYRKLLSLPAIALYATGLRRTPPAVALRGVKANIDHSLQIWTKAFGPL